MDENYRRLPLETIYNARDLGGYPTVDGYITKFRQFVRCEAPSSVSDKDMEFLKAYGITTSIDFRSDMEVEHFPSAFVDKHWVKYFRQTMFNEQVAKGAERRLDKGHHHRISSFVQWDKMYIEMLENYRQWVRGTLEIIASREGAIIYNCTTGKDRTGLMSAILLGIAGVSEMDICADYCVSQIYLRPVYEVIGKYLPGARPDGQVDLNDPFFKTEPESMMKLLEYLNNQYGSIVDYVKSCKVSNQVIDDIKTRFLIGNKR